MEYQNIIPREFGQDISDNEIYSFTQQGLSNLLALIEDKHKIPATFFTTANFAKKYPRTLKEMSKNHEIACHGYNHSDNYKKDLSLLSSLISSS